MNKQCINCNLIKNLDEFQTRNRGEKIEYLGRCRICETERIHKWKQNKSVEKKKKKIMELGITEKIEEGNKHCTNCLKVKKLEEFGYREKITGIFARSWCKECEKNTKREYDRQKGVQPKKITKQCRYCKNDFPLNELSKTYYCINCRDDEVVEGFKRCTLCKKVKELIDFSYRTQKGSKPFPRSNCKICYKIVEYPRLRILQALRSQNVMKSIHSFNLIGCSFLFLRKWLEWQFNSKMSWKNMGSYWHIDHVIPCASFKLLNEEEQLKCFNWKNLRPLEKTQNLQKNDKILPREILHQEIKLNIMKNQLKAQRLNEHG